jgi:hypothetical protein
LARAMGRHKEMALFGVTDVMALET